MGLTTPEVAPWAGRRGSRLPVVPEACEQGGCGVREDSGLKGVGLAWLGLDALGAREATLCDPSLTSLVGEAEGQRPAAILGRAAQGQPAWLACGDGSRCPQSPGV